jgi:hypothetical protein
MRRNGLLALLLVMVVTWPSFAHGPMRFVGVVTSLDGDVIAVKTADGKSITVAIKGAAVTRNGKPAKRSDVKVNANVVPDGIGDHPGNFSVRTIQLVPPIAPKKK